MYGSRAAADDHAASTTVSVDEFKAAMASFAAGVTIVTTLDQDGVPYALTATAFSSVSLNPPLCLVCIDKRSKPYKPLVLNGHFAVNILSAEQERLSAQFAASVAERFAGVEWSPGAVTGCPIIHGALAWLECEVVEVYAGGDHDIFIGQLRTVRVHHGAPLVYWRGRYSSLPPAPEAEDAPDSETASPAAAT